MSEILSDRRYSESHEWAGEEDQGIVKVGITDHAQAQLGDLVFVELPEVGSHVAQGDSCAVVESVKAASDIYSPVSGEVVDINDQLADAPEMVNADPYNDGWLFSVRIEDAEELNNLMTPEGYTAHTQD